MAFLLFEFVFLFVFLFVLQLPLTLLKAKVEVWLKRIASKGSADFFAISFDE
jgi:hypothetical protein